MPNYVTPVRVQAIGGTSDNKVAVMSLAAKATTAGDAIVVAVAFYATLGTYPTCTVTDSKGNTYESVYTFSGSSTTGPSLLIVAAYGTVALTTADHIIATFVGNAPYAVMLADEWSGFSGVFDGTVVAASGGPGITISFGPLTTSAGTDAVMTFIGTFGNLPNATSWSAGWLGKEFQSSGPSVFLAWQIPTSAQRLTGTTKIRASEYWHYAMVPFRANALPAASTPAKANVLLQSVKRAANW